MGRAPAPQRLRHYHRPVISFKEQLLLSCKQLTVSRIRLRISQLLTAYRSLAKFRAARSLLRLPLYMDLIASAAGTCRVPKLPGMSNNQALRHRRLLRHSFVAADESRRGLACPSTTAVRSSSFCQGTCVWPDPSRARETIFVRCFPTPASDKCGRIHPSNWSRRPPNRTFLQRNAEKGSAPSAALWNLFVQCSCRVALRLISGSVRDASTNRAGFEPVSVVEATLLHFTPPAHSTLVREGCQ